jgi:septal ring factor EnvC (AmiA/AmiB activator)
MRQNRSIYQLTYQTASLSQFSQYAPEESPAPPITRSATDSISVKIKRERDEDTPLRPKKHPRRTLSEQIVVTKFPESLLSPKSPVPRSPAPERVNRALTDRIQHLKDENAGLKDDVTGLESDKAELQRKITKDARNYRALRAESEQIRQDLVTVMARLTNMEGEVAILRAKVEKSEKRSKG